MFSFNNRPQEPVRLSLYDASAAELSSDNTLIALCLGPIEIPFILYSEIPKYISDGYLWTYEPKLDKWTERGNNIISIKNGNKIVLSEVQYDKDKNSVYPPR